MVFYNAFSSIVKESIPCSISHMGLDVSRANAGGVQQASRNEWVVYPSTIIEHFKYKSAMFYNPWKQLACQHDLFPVCIMQGIPKAPTPIHKADGIY